MKTDCTSAFRQDGVTSRFTLHARDDPRTDEAHEGRRPVRCVDHERSRSPEALVRLRRCPWRRAASHAAGPGRGHGAERLARSGAHATKGWEEAPRERAAPSRAGRPRDEAGHGDGDARARGGPAGGTGGHGAPWPHRAGSRACAHRPGWKPSRFAGCRARCTPILPRWWGVMSPRRSSTLVLPHKY